MKFKKDGKDQAQLIKQLTAAARRLDHTVSDIADADSLAHGEVELTIKRTDLEALVKRVVEDSGVGADHDVRDRQPAGGRGHRPAPGGAGAGRVAAASGDRTPHGKAITVRLAHTNGGALLSVEDPEPASDGAMSASSRSGSPRCRAAGRGSRDVREGASAFKVFLPDGGPSGDGPVEPPALDEAGSGTEGDAPAGTLQIVVNEPPTQAEHPFVGDVERAPRSSCSCRSCTGCTPRTERRGSAISRAASGAPGRSPAAGSGSCPRRSA